MAFARRNFSDVCESVAYCQRRKARLASIQRTIEGAGVSLGSVLPAMHNVVSEELPPLIPRAVIFGNPEFFAPSLSPDGRHLGYLAPDDKGVLQVWVRTLGLSDDRVVTADPERGIPSYNWSFDGQHLLYTQDVEGDENDNLYVVDILSGSTRNITPYEGIQAQLVALSPWRPHELIVAMNLRDRHSHDLFRLSLDGLSCQLEAENPGDVVVWATDSQLHPRACLAATDSGAVLLVRSSLTQPWESMRQWGPNDQCGIVGLSESANVLYILSDHGANALRLLAMDLAGGAEAVVAEDPKYDVAGMLTHPLSNVVQAVTFSRQIQEWMVVDPSIAPDFRALAQVRRGEIAVTSRDLSDRLWVTEYNSDDAPVHYYLYDRSTGQSSFLSSHRRCLENSTLARTTSVSFPATDGLELHGYLTVPPRVVAKNLPCVLLVHGGPWMRDFWGYDPQVQWLANRGYVVLQVNFRGSTGYGKDFLNAGNREWGGKMQDDLIDAVRWLIHSGTVDARRIGIMGTSYGGYAALAGLAFTPDVFAAGVDIVGPSNIVTLLSTTPPYWASQKATLDARVGDVEKDKAFLESRSPLFCAERIQRPLLVVQGANDPRVNQVESEQLVSSLRRLGRSVEYVVYTDEGHGPQRPANRLHFFATAERFLAKHLGGRCEPVVDECAGHCGVER